MANPIWKEARRRAGAETIELLRLNSLPRVLLTAGTPVVAFIATLGLTGQLAIAAAATLVWTTFCGTVIYIGKLVHAPAKMAAERDLELAALRDAARIPKHSVTVGAEAGTNPVEGSGMMLSITVRNTLPTPVQIASTEAEIFLNGAEFTKISGTAFLLHSASPQSFQVQICDERPDPRDGEIRLLIKLTYGPPDETATRQISQTTIVSYQYRGAITFSRATNQEYSDDPI